MITKVGDKVKNNLTGKVYELRMVRDEWVLLEEESRISQVLTEIENIKFLYGKVNYSEH
jgi:hypothetical protein